MRKRILRIILATLSIMVLMLTAGISAVAAGNGTNDGTGKVNSRVGDAQITPLSDEEISWLTYMREEEKLARDVYIYLYDEYESRIFNNIAASEQKHMDAIKTLLDRYGISDPAAGKGMGEFINTDIQALYVKLTADGSISLEEALKAGIFIEETDIQDLEKGISTTTHKDIRNVYSNLLRGSLNHLDAFQSELAKL